MALTTGAPDRARISTHEAGHALMCYLVGVPVRSVSRERVGGFLGRCFHEPPRHAGASAAIVAAGLAAELVTYGEYDRAHAAHDLEALRRHTGGDEDAIALVIESAQIRLGRRAESDALTVLAGCIFDEGFVSGDRVHGICDLYGVEPVRQGRRIRKRARDAGPAKLVTYPRPTQRIVRVGDSIFIPGLHGRIFT